MFQANLFHLLWCQISQRGPGRHTGLAEELFEAGWCDKPNDIQTFCICLESVPDSARDIGRIALAEGFASFSYDTNSVSVMNEKSLIGVLMSMHWN